MENGLNIFRYPSRGGGSPDPPDDDDRKWKTVEYKVKVGSRDIKVDVPLMTKLSKRGAKRPLDPENVEIIQLKDADGNIYLAAAGK